MVVLDYPDSTCRDFFMFQSTVFGPIDLNGEYKAVQIPLQLATSRFEPKKRIYDENEIVHSDFDGTVFYYPILADCIPTPTDTCPRSLKMPYRGSTTPLSCHYGFGCPNEGALVRALSSCTMQTVLRRGPNKWRLSRMLASWPTSLSYYYVWDFTVTRTSSSQVKISYTYWRSIDGQKAPFDYSHDVQSQVILDFMSRYTRWTSSTGTAYATTYTTDPSVARSAHELSQELGRFADTLMNGEFPLQEVNYGELAAKAVKQKRVIDANLFEFLRDLKDVKSLIPKLSNLKKLRNLKGLAGKFLAVKYGVLPTISDLKEIVGVFQMRKPYFDKYGNQVFNASHIVEEKGLRYTYSLTQYIKVPVANEDSDLLRLFSAMDEYGFGLTLENVWDLVQYSFVLDWFIDVGGFLERVDNNQRLLRYNIPYVTMSRKKAVSGELPQTAGLSIVGPVSWRYYHRWVDSHCPLPPVTLSVTPTVSDHWLEAGALLIQRAR